MDDPAKVARLLLGSATTMVKAVGARAIVVAIDALPDVEAVPPNTILMARDEIDHQLLYNLQ